MELTLQEIMKPSDVSKSTEKRVSKHTGNESVVTSNKAKRISDNLGFNKKMLSLQKRGHLNNQLIALVVPHLNNPIYNEIIDGAQDTAFGYGYNLVITQSCLDNNFHKELHRLSSPYIRGLISLDQSVHINKLTQFISPSLPVVQCCDYDDHLPYPAVAIDDYKAAKNAVNYLYSIGHRRIAFFNSTCDTVYGAKREEGYRDGLEQCSLPYTDDLVFHLDKTDYNIAFTMALKMFSSPNRPDAIFTVSDIYAAAVIHAAKTVGLDVPKDVAIIGFDNTDISVITNPPITTISQPLYAIGSTACHILVDLIQGKAVVSKKLLMQTDLIIRSST